MLINETILIDCGHNAPGSLKIIDRLESITDIFITHLHGDHCHGLETMGFMALFVFKRKTNLWISKPMESSLWNEVLKGTMKHIKNDYLNRETKLSDFYNINYYEDHDFSVEIGNITFELIKTEHVPNKISYSISILENGSREYLYSSDINSPITDFVSYADDYKIIFHDCQLFETGSDIHTTIQQLRKLPESLRKKIVLMHYGEGIEKEDTSMFRGYAKKYEQYS